MVTVSRSEFPLKHTDTLAGRIVRELKTRCQALVAGYLFRS